MPKIELDLKLQNGNCLFFNYTEKMKQDIHNILMLYKQLPNYNRNIDYRHNMIKTVLTDIDIENADNTSVIESLAAICCNKIKNKNQKTALNLLCMLESGVLEGQKELTNEYIVKIWRNLTDGNKEFLAFGDGYRKTGVKLGKGGPLALGKNVVYVAPPAKEVPNMMNSLIKFLNATDVIIDNRFEDILLKIIVFSVYFVYIHPFLDGNGRVSRLLVNKLLIDNGLEKFRYISVNSEIIKDKKEYSKQLLKVEQEETGDLTNYVSYMLNIFSNLMNRLGNPNRRSLDYKSLTDRQKIMLNCIRGSAQGIYVKQYKNFWNNIAQVEGYKKIKVEDAEKDLTELLMKDFIVYDSRYVLYPGFKYYNK